MAENKKGIGAAFEKIGNAVKGAAKKIASAGKAALKFGQKAFQAGKEAGKVSLGKFNEAADAVSNAIPQPEEKEEAQEEDKQEEKQEEKGTKVTKSTTTGKGSKKDSDDEPELPSLAETAKSTVEAVKSVVNMPAHIGGAVGKFASGVNDLFKGNKPGDKNEAGKDNQQQQTKDDNNTAQQQAGQKPNKLVEFGKLAFNLAKDLAGPQQYQTGQSSKPKQENEQQAQSSKQQDMSNSVQGTLGMKGNKGAKQLDFNHMAGQLKRNVFPGDKSVQKVGFEQNDKGGCKFDLGKYGSASISGDKNNISLSNINEKSLAAGMQMAKDIGGAKAKVDISGFNNDKHKDMAWLAAKEAGVKPSGHKPGDDVKNQWEKQMKPFMEQQQGQGLAKNPASDFMKKGVEMATNAVSAVATGVKGAAKNIANKAADMVQGGMSQIGSHKIQANDSLSQKASSKPQNTDSQESEPANDNKNEQKWQSARPSTPRMGG